jgi:hypothetical protein
MATIATIAGAVRGHHAGHRGTGRGPATWGTGTISLLFLLALSLGVVMAAPAQAEVVCGGFNKQGRWMGDCSTKKATPLHRAGCKAKSELGFYDPVDGGTCWACPPDYGRYAFSHIKSDRACSSHGRPWARATFLGKPQDCGEGKFYDPIEGGTCWSCPKGYHRSLTHVKSNAACFNPGMEWKTPKYNIPQLYALPGAVDILKSIYWQPYSLTSFMRLLVEKAGLRGAAADKVIDAAWKTHALPDGQLMKTFIYNRMVIVAQSGEGSDADKKLVAGFEAFIRDFRIFLAQDALAAYDAWKRADDHRKAKAPKNMMLLWDYGTPPPDFSANAQAAIVGVSLAAPAAATIGMWTTANIASTTAIAAAKASETAVIAVKLLSHGTAAAQAMHSTAQALSGAAALKAAAASGTAAAVASVGPTLVALPFAIMAGVSLNRFIAIVNARPALLEALKTAQKPVSLKEMLKTEDGKKEAASYWGMIVSQPANAGPIMFDYNRAYKERHQKPLPATVSFSMPTSNAASAPATAPTAATPANQQVRSLPPALQREWQQIDGAARDIAVADDGTVWIIGTGKGTGGYDLYRRGPRDANWQKIYGWGTRVGAGKTAWHINDAGNIYRLDGSRWTQIPGPKAVDVGAGGGKVYMLGGNPINGKSYAVHVLDGNTWKKISGSGVRIDVDDRGNPWVLSHDSSIWVQINQAPFNGKWAQIAGKGMDIGVHTGPAGAVVGTDGAVWLRDAKTSKWNSKTVKAQAVAMGPDNKVWAIMPGGEILKQK